jgi:hypothetical protein
MDLSIFRDFPVTERIKIQFRAEAFNLSNTPHFGNPNANVSNAQFNGNTLVNANSFGQVTSTAQLSRLIDARYFRFGVRISF